MTFWFGLSDKFTIGSFPFPFENDHKIMSIFPSNCNYNPPYIIGEIESQWDFNCYLVVVVRLKNCTVETVWQGVALHILGSVLSSLCGKSGDFHDLAKINLNPLIFIVVLRKPAAAIASFIFVTDSGSVGTPVLVVLWGGRNCWIGKFVWKLDTKRRSALYLWFRKTWTSIW